jgi:hypothetical protein
VIWGIAYLVGFGLAIWGCHEWLVAHHHRDDWLGDDPGKPVSGLLAAVVYWPLAIGLWWLLYPGDNRAWPFADDDR